MRRCVAVVVVIVLLLCSAPLRAQQVFNLALLGLGSNVIPVYLESDAGGLKLAIVLTTTRGYSGYYLVNPRRGPLPGQIGLFCYEPVPSLDHFVTPSNPSMDVIVNTINVDGKTVVQLVDRDASDGVAPWVLIESKFSYCK